MKDNIQERVIKIISSIMSVPQENLDESSSPESVDKWESMKHINLVLAIEEEFNIQFDDEQIAQLHDVRSIVKIIEGII
jgi:acyl carrier protein